MSSCTMGISKCALVVVLFASASVGSSSLLPKTQPAELERRQSWTAFNNLSPHRFRVNNNNLLNPFFGSHVPANVADGRARFIDNDKGLIIKVSDYSDYYGGGLPIPPGDGLSVFASGPPSLREARRDQDDFRIEDLDDFDDDRKNNNNKEEEDDIFKDVSDDPFLSVIVSAAADNPELLDPESSPDLADEGRNSKEENEEEFQGPAKKRVARSAVLGPAEKVQKRKSQLKPQVRDSYHVPIYAEAPGDGPLFQKFGIQDAVDPLRSNYPVRNGFHHSQNQQDDQTDESDTYAADGEGESAEAESNGAAGTYFNHQQQAQDDTYSNVQVNIGHGPEPDDEEEEADGDRPQYADGEGEQSYLQQQQPHHTTFLKNDYDDDRQYDFPKKRAFYKRAQPYHFQYYVKDDFTHNDFGQQERSDGNAVHGSYRVKLPDGRTQIVSYIADRKTGYQANVKYEGTAHHPPPSYYKDAKYQDDLGNLKIKF